MAENVELSLLEKLVERSVQARLQPLHDQLWAHHVLLTELVRQLPRPALLAALYRLDQMGQQLPVAQKAHLQAVHQSWHLYLNQLAAVVDGDTPPPIAPAPQGAEPRQPAR